MDQVDNLKNNLIDKILAIKNEDVLQALDHFLSSSSTGDLVSISAEQKQILKRSEQDISTSQFVSQDELDRQDLGWLKKK